MDKRRFLMFIIPKQTGIHALLHFALYDNRYFLLFFSN